MSEKPRAECYDCGLPYSSLGFQDLVVPDVVWEKISPTGHEGGLLCPNCMVRRSEERGIETEAVWRSGPFFQALEHVGVTVGDYLSTKIRWNDLPPKSGTLIYILKGGGHE